MRALAGLIRKEVYHILRDRRTLVVIVALPVLQVILFGYAIRTDVDHGRVASGGGRVGRWRLAGGSTPPASFAPSPCCRALTGCPRSSSAATRRARSSSTRNSANR